MREELNKVIETISQNYAEKHGEDLSREEILKLSPQELAGYLKYLEEHGRLEIFLIDSSRDDALEAKLSVIEKWLTKHQQQLLDQVVKKKKEMYPGNSERLPLNLDEKFDENELKAIVSNIVGIQLTFGCSKACPFCAADAVPGVREHIPYAQLANLFKRYGELLKETQPFLYWASEPSDYKDESSLPNRTYEDVHQLAVEFAGYSPVLTSKESKDERWLKFMGASDIRGARVSVYGKSEEEVRTIESNLPQQVKLVGKQKEHQKGIGVSFFEEEDNIRKKRANIVFHCQDGIVLTPRGLYNSIRVPISEKFPGGTIEVPVEKRKNIEIKVGQKLQELLENGAIAEANHRKTLYIPFYKIRLGDVSYAVAVDEDLTITKFMPFDDINPLSHDEKMQAIADAHSVRNGYAKNIQEWLEADPFFCVERNNRFKIDIDHSRGAIIIFKLTPLGNGLASPFGVSFYPRNDEAKQRFLDSISHYDEEELGSLSWEEMQKVVGYLNVNVRSNRAEALYM